MKKYQSILLLIIISPIIGGLYGILHDQITYTISPEYYTEFKFYQFGILEEGNEVKIDYPRLEVAKVGFLATWWMGLLIGFILGLISLFKKGNKDFLKTSLKSYFVVILVSLITGISGLLYGKLFLSKNEIDWWLPETLLINKNNFIAVGSMHNFSYFGGLIGLIISATYIIKSKKSNEPKASM